VYSTVTVPDYAKDPFGASGVFVQVSGAEQEAWRAGVSSLRRNFSRTEAVSLLTGLYVARQPMMAVSQVEILNASGAVHRESRNVQVGTSNGLAGTNARHDRPHRFHAHGLSKTLAWSSGHHRSWTFPTMYFFGTSPQSRLSELLFRWSPRTK
jgi:hypothetical protein